MKQTESLGPYWADAYTAECRAAVAAKTKSFEADQRPPLGWWFTKRQFKRSFLAEESRKARMRGSYAAGSTRKFKIATGDPEC